MSSKDKVAQNPLILRYHRLMDAFAKSDDERDYFLDKIEGFIVYLNLGKSEKDLLALEEELKGNPERYCLMPKLTFYETKKLMEGFVNEKVYDIDTKEKLLDIIQSKDAREHFLEFIYDHLHELEKWQQFYQERSRIRIIEWLRDHEFTFVFEEDLELPLPTLENLKKYLFEAKAPKDVLNARKILVDKSKTYYSNEALNPRPKRGRPPKQVVKVETEPQYTEDIYSAVPSAIRPFLYSPDITSASSVIFSTKYGSEEEFLASMKSSSSSHATKELEELTKRLASLQDLSSRLATAEETPAPKPKKSRVKKDSNSKTTSEEPKTSKKTRSTSTNTSEDSPTVKKKLKPLKKTTTSTEKVKPRRLTPSKPRKKKAELE
jgi:hypothetical protein